MKNVLEKIWLASIVAAFAFVMLFGASDMNIVSDTAVWIATGCTVYLIGNLLIAKKYINEK